MDWNLVVTDMVGRNRAFPVNWDGLKVTRRLGDFCDGEVKLDIYDPNAAEFLVGQRAMKFYRGSTLRLYGTIWEPLEKEHPGGITAVIRDPFALWAWRRCRAQKTYTAADAGAIALDRIAIQNGYQDSHLRIGAVAVSVNRTIVINPGKREDEFIQDLSNMSQGFFFIVNPVDAAGATFAELVVGYPNAGVTREECRFEYGPGTRDNLKKVKIIQNLPRTREVAASSASTGGRIQSVIEDTPAQAVYNIIEDEIAVSDITDTTILAAFAGAEIRVAPPEQYELTPNLNSPLLFQDFDVGDFVRLRVLDGSDDIWSWVRVTEATLAVDKEGVESLEKITVETLVGGKPYTRPEDLLRVWLDENRARQEMLERKVENITATAAAPPSAPAGGGTGFDPTYTPPPQGGSTAPPPPPSPDIPPTVSGLYGGPLSWSDVQIDVDIDPGNLPTSVSVSGQKSADGGTMNGPGHRTFTFGGLPHGHDNVFTVTASNAAGSSSQSVTVHTPAVNFS